MTTSMIWRDSKDDLQCRHQRQSSQRATHIYKEMVKQIMKVTANLKHQANVEMVGVNDEIIEIIAHSDGTADLTVMTEQGDVIGEANVNHDGTNLVDAATFIGKAVELHIEDMSSGDERTTIEIVEDVIDEYAG